MHAVKDTMNNCLSERCTQADQKLNVHVDKFVDTLDNGAARADTAIMEACLDEAGYAGSNADVIRNVIKHTTRTSCNDVLEFVLNLASRTRSGKRQP
jgi:hypothetical protein